ncbi:MAG: glycosyltransferase family 4 protein [Spirochaetales bacterium]|nr:glycosyltransferase family 4 protein [Spirochaetales bacterium]
MKPTIIGFFLRDEIKTGSHKRYLELLNKISLKNNKVIVILSNTINTESYNFITIKVAPVTKGRLPFSLKQALKLLPIILKLQKDSYVVLSFGETNYLSLKLIKLLRKAKIIFAFRSNTFRALKDENDNYRKSNNLKTFLKLKKMLFIEKDLTKISNKIIFQTAFDRDDICTRTRTEIGKTSIIPNSINESWFLPEFRNTNNSNQLKTIIFLGSYSDRKGAIFLLNAIKILHDSAHPIKLDMYGYGEEKIKLGLFIKENNLEEIVQLNNAISNPISIIGKYDLMIVPSIYDSYPNVILESLFTGTPVIASNNSGMKEILYYEELLFETAEPKSIANRIKTLLNHDSYIDAKMLCKKRAEEHNFIWVDKFITEIELL